MNTAHAARSPRAIIRAAALAVSAAILLLVAHGAARAQTCFTPLEWQPKLGARWTHDVDGNDVDDWIDHLRPDTTLDLLLALNDCASSQDLSRFATYGQLGYRSRFVSVVGLRHVTAANAVALGADPRVAEVFPDLQTQRFLNISVPAMRVSASSAYSPQTIADLAPGIDGHGVNIAIIDTGVDDQQHVTFAGGRYVGGYDFANNLAIDPDDAFGHGTHVAGIALGSAFPYRGVAPGAGLVDMKDSNGESSPISVSIRAVDSCITQRAAWNIRVINASFGMDQYPDGSDAPSNGLDPLSQAFDAASRAGIVVVAAAGNSGRALIGWGAASSEAITVGAVDDRGSVSRIDDVVAAFSSRGPRRDNGNRDSTDEQKPELTAPGTAPATPTAPLPLPGIMSAQFNTASGWVRMQGTSMAAPHVTGLVALLLEQRPDLAPRQVKQLLVRTAEDRGTPGWNPDWGYGLVDGYAAMNALITGATDVGFQEYCNAPGIWWETPDVTPQNPVIVAGVPNVIQADVRNMGPVPATQVHVKLGVYNFGNDMAMYDLADVVIANLDAGADTVVTTAWTPGHSGPSPGTMHACLKAEIVYGPDPQPIDNCAQHNVEIQSAPPAGHTIAGVGAALASVPMSGAAYGPLTYTMQVVNPTTEFLSVDVHDVAGELAGSGWTLTPPGYGIGLGPGDCPATLTFTLTPSDTPRTQVRAAMAVTGYRMAGGTIDLGGATLVAQLPATTAVPGASVAGRIELAVWPNPAHGATVVRWALPVAGEVRIGIYDATGRQVRTLAASHATAGRHDLAWDGRDDAGRPLASGAYWVRMRQGGASLSRMLLRVE